MASGQIPQNANAAAPNKQILKDYNLAGELDSKSDGDAESPPFRNSLAQYKDGNQAKVKEDTDEVINRVRRAQTQKESKVKELQDAEAQKKKEAD